jgi:hypothetical protein
MGLIAQPLHAFAFGSWLPLNILLTFTWRRWPCMRWRTIGRCCCCWLLACCRCSWTTSGPALARAAGLDRVPASGVVAAAGWACGGVLGQPQRLGIAGRSGGAAGRAGAVALPRWRWVFYGYYVGHLAVLALVAHLLVMSELACRVVLNADAAGNARRRWG